MIITQPIPGTLLVDGEKVALRLNEPEAAETVHLAYALVTQGPEHQILPSVMLDDWGNEVSSLKLYAWIRENGLRFPRAEVFGESPAGAPVQYFLRDLELFGRFPVYAFREADAPAASGVLVRDVLVPDDATDAPQPTEPPENIPPPLRDGHLRWWRVNPRQAGLGFIE